MQRYDAEVAPAGDDWLETDEGERVQLVEEYHRGARIPLPERAEGLHASMHVIVENQLALNDEPVVRALGHLMKEGLSRHEAVHAIGSVVAEEIYDLLNEDDAREASGAGDTAIERLFAARWRASGDD